jgi:acyl-CoA synthetase (AMP-forming)/AMP-acid ligase II
VEHVIETIREAVALEHDLQVYALALIEPGRIPKTSSGKIQRRAARRKFLEGEFEVVAEWRASASKRTLCPSWRLGVPQLSTRG